MGKHSLLLLLIYINNLPKSLSTNPKLFVDDASFFSVVRDLHTSTNETNNDFKKNEAWDHQWKMSFNPGLLKQAQKVIFSRERNKPYHADRIFNGNLVKESSYQKHLGMFLDILKKCFIKLIKLLVLFTSFEIYLPRSLLLQINKPFVVPYLN